MQSDIASFDSIGYADKLATLLNVSADAIALTVEPASVRVTAVIEVSNQATANTAASVIDLTFSNTTAASSVLGVQIEALVGSAEVGFVVTPAPQMPPPTPPLPLSPETAAMPSTPPISASSPPLLPPTLRDDGSENAQTATSGGGPVLAIVIIMGLLTCTGMVSLGVIRRRCTGRLGPDRANGSLPKFWLALGSKVLTQRDHQRTRDTTPQSVDSGDVTIRIHSDERKSLGNDPSSLLTSAEGSMPATQQERAERLGRARMHAAALTTATSPVPAKSKVHSAPHAGSAAVSLPNEALKPADAQATNTLTPSSSAPLEAPQAPCELAAEPTPSLKAPQAPCELVSEPAPVLPPVAAFPSLLIGNEAPIGLTLSELHTLIELRRAHDEADSPVSTVVTPSVGSNEPTFEPPVLVLEPPVLVLGSGGTAREALEDREEGSSAPGSSDAHQPTERTARDESAHTSNLMAVPDAPMLIEGDLPVGLTLEELRTLRQLWNDHDQDLKI